MYIVYKNKYNEVKPYSLEVRAENEEYIDAIDLKENRFKTFKISNILLTLDTFEDAESEAANLQKNYTPLTRTKSSGNRMPSRDNWNNKEGLFEVCFTGFPAQEKKELIQFAKDNGLFDRTRVTKNLGLLVCGKTAGWKKIIEANKLNVPRVYGQEGFYNFLETGEFAE